MAGMKSQPEGAPEEKSRRDGRKPGSGIEKREGDLYAPTLQKEKKNLATKARKRKIDVVAKRIRRHFSVEESRADGGATAPG